MLGTKKIGAFGVYKRKGLSQNSINGRMADGRKEEEKSEIKSEKMIKLCQWFTISSSPSIPAVRSSNVYKMFEFLELEGRGGGSI